MKSWFLTLICNLFITNALAAPLKTNSEFWKYEFSKPEDTASQYLESMKKEKYGKAFFCFDYKLHNYLTRAAVYSDFEVYSESENWQKFVFDYFTNKNINITTSIIAFDQAMAHVKKNNSSSVSWWDDWVLKNSTMKEDYACVLAMHKDKEKEMRIFLTKSNVEKWKISGFIVFENKDATYWPSAFKERLDKRNKFFNK